MHVCNKHILYNDKERIFKGRPQGLVFIYTSIHVGETNKLVSHKKVTYVSHTMANVTYVSHTKNVMDVSHICQNVTYISHIWSVTQACHLLSKACKHVLLYNVSVNTPGPPVEYHTISTFSKHFWRLFQQLKDFASFGRGLYQKDYCYGTCCHLKFLICHFEATSK